MTNIAQQTLAGIVTGDYRAAFVLEKHQLDFCCKGKRTLADACAEKGISPEEIVTEISAVTKQGQESTMPFSEMTADQLIAHIVTHHHFYVKQSMPQIYEHLEKVALKHGDHYPWMVDVFSLFAELRNEMVMHMHKEERVLFPAIRQAEAALEAGSAVSNETKIIKGAIRMMESEHDSAGEIMHRIREITNDYAVPVGACTTFRLTLSELSAFEEDLHRHVHLENNLLFPMAAHFVK